MNKPAKKILIVGPAWVGDMVMAQTLFILLKQRHINLIIDVLAPDWSRPLLERMPEVNQAMVLPIGHGKLGLIQRFKIARALKNNHYQQAILLPNSFKSAVIPFLGGIPKRTGWRGEMRWGLLNDIRYLNKDELPLMIDRFMALGLPKDEKLSEQLIRPTLQINNESVTAATHKFSLTSNDKPILALCPGAEFGPAKQWPTEYYAKIANEKLAQDWQVWVFGSKNDSKVASNIQQATQSKCIDLTGKTSLAEAIDLLSLAHAVISNDSGLMHIAAALNRPLVVVYGSSSPKFTPPLSDNVKILQLDLACSPCFKRQCPLEHLRCLRDLKPERVLQALEAVKY